MDVQYSFVYISMTLFGATILRIKVNLMSDLLNMF